MGPAPGRRRAEVVERARSGCPGELTHRHEGPGGVGGGDRGEVEPTAVGRAAPAPAGSRPGSRPSRRSGRRSAGYRTVSRSGVRSCSHCGSVPTNSLVPTHAATVGGRPSTPKRRASQPAAASRSAGRADGRRVAPLGCPTPTARRPRPAAAGRSACRSTGRRCRPASAAGDRSAGRRDGRRGTAGARSRGRRTVDPHGRRRLGDELAQAPGRRPGQPGPDAHRASVSSVRRDHLALAVHRGEHVAAVVGHDQLDDRRQRPQPVAEGAQQVVDALAGERHRPPPSPGGRRPGAWPRAGPGRPC